MTDLSYDALHVRLAAIYAGPELEGRIAAVLRALDRQLGHEVLGVRCVDCSQIQLIAAELEAHR